MVHSLLSCRLRAWLYGESPQPSYIKMQPAIDTVAILLIYRQFFLAASDLWRVHQI
ncbi:MAG: hypothetical protein K0B14_17395 [Anaerolineaceae bacterium]|nr:hypothetical protein [Anaerolineaceae bacterium]